jgi:uncharacterized repeat protein (TIGR03943 family)
LTVIVAWIAGFCLLCASIGSAPLLDKFLRPDYAWIVHVGVGILVLFVVALVYCEPHNRGRRGIGLLLQMTIMVLPLLYLPTAISSELSPEAARKRSVSVARSDAGMGNRSVGKEFTIGAKKNTANAKLPEDPSLIQLILEGKHYSGKRVTTVGKVCLDDRLPAQAFFCYRLLMICCAADARPVGILVYRDKADTLENGAWVKVTGTVGLSKFEDHDVVKIAAEHIEPTAPPKVPYLFP